MYLHVGSVSKSVQRICPYRLIGILIQHQVASSDRCWARNMTKARIRKRESMISFFRFPFRFPFLSLSPFCLVCLARSKRERERGWRMSSSSCEALAGAWKLSSTGAHVRKGKWKHQQCHMMSLHPRKKNEKEKEKLSTFSASITTDLPLYESPAASFDEYLSNRSRIFQAMFPDNKQRSQRLNDDEWRIQMLPLDFFFLSVRPLIDIRLECKSEGKNYPSGVPLHVSRVLELEVTRWELPGLEGVLRPSHFSLGVRGALYSERQGIQSRLKGQLELSVSCILPRELALVPDDVLRGVSEAVLKRLVENMKQNVNERLLLDFSNFRKERFQIKGKMVVQPQPPNHFGSEQTFNDI